MIWTLATMLKCPCSAFFFSNYVQHFNDIRDTLFSWFERQRIKKNYIVHQFHEITPQNKSTKLKKAMI